MKHIILGLALLTGLSAAAQCESICKRADRLERAYNRLSPATKTSPEGRKAYAYFKAAEGRCRSCTETGFVPAAEGSYLNLTMQTGNAFGMGVDFGYAKREKNNSLVGVGVGGGLAAQFGRENPAQVYISVPVSFGIDQSFLVVPSVGYESNLRKENYIDIPGVWIPGTYVAGYGYVPGTYVSGTTIGYGDNIGNDGVFVALDLLIKTAGQGVCGFGICYGDVSGTSLRFSLGVAIGKPSSLKLPREVVDSGKKMPQPSYY